MKRSAAEYWAPRINAEWRKSVEGIVGVGLRLIEAKAACDHGEFLRLFRGHKDAVADPVPFGVNSADRLMAIARSEVLSNCDQSHNLPASWQTLYELSRLDDEQIAAGIKAGEITPDMTRGEAAALRSDPIERPETPPHEEIVTGAKNAVTKSIGKLTTQAEFAFVKRRLAELIEFVERMEEENGIGRSRKTRTETSAG